MTASFEKQLAVIAENIGTSQYSKALTQIKSLAWQADALTLETLRHHLAEMTPLVSSDASLKKRLLKKRLDGVRDLVEGRQRMKTAMACEKAEAVVADQLWAYFKIQEPTPDVPFSILGLSDLAMLSNLVAKWTTRASLDRWKASLHRGFQVGHGIFSALPPDPRDRIIAGERLANALESLALNRIAGGVALEVVEKPGNRAALLAWGIAHNPDELTEMIDERLASTSEPDMGSSSGSVMIEEIRKMGFRDASDQKLFATWWAVAVLVGMAQGLIDLEQTVESDPQATPNAREDELGEKLAALRDAGVLTDAEFEEKKRLLG